MSRSNRQLAAGTAMTEIILALPMYLFVMFLVLFFGQAYVHRQRVQVACHYSTWQAQSGSLPSDQALRGKLLNAVPTDLMQRIEDADADHADFWIAQVRGFDDDAGDLADEVILHRRWGQVTHEGARIGLRNWRGSLWVEYPHSIALLDWLDTRYVSHESREGREWARGEASNERLLTELYYDDMDQGFRAIDIPDQDDLAKRIRNLYYSTW